MLEEIRSLVEESNAMGFDIPIEMDSEKKGLDLQEHISQGNL